MDYRGKREKGGEQKWRRGGSDSQGVPLVKLYAAHVIANKRKVLVARLSYGKC